LQKSKPPAEATKTARSLLRFLPLKFEVMDINTRINNITVYIYCEYIMIIYIYTCDSV
jgi:hypothetical protein